VGEGRLECPRCADAEPWEILHASLSAMERGMHDAASDAELISWLYMPETRGPRRDDVADWVYEIPAHTPGGVTLAFNFETGVRRTQCGKELVGGDYWLSTPGPSPRFERIAGAARVGGTPVCAKIQASCSHEVATVPHVPVPTLLYRKLAGMRRLGVSSTMLCWYFGNYPGLMNRGAGELSFEPFPEDEDAFLRRLAAIHWGEEHAAAVVEAWKAFGEGYENFPLTVLFQYYGPMHDGPVWPLLLKPEDAPLNPTWLLASESTREPWPPGGDRIGECILDALSLDDAVELTRRMSAAWDRGVAILQSLAPQVAEDRERTLDIGVARALGIQFRTGHNILRFYAKREAMFRMQGEGRLAVLEELAAIVREELELNEELLTLCARDSRLGFHSEAEGYKYHPEMIRWRMRQLRHVLDGHVPELERIIRGGAPLFPEYTGARPTGAVARSAPCDDSLWRSADLAAPPSFRWEDCRDGADVIGVSWAAGHDAQALYVAASGPAEAARSADAPPIGRVLVKIEPRRLWPCKHFEFVPGAPARAELADRVAPQSVEGRVIEVDGRWRAALRIPFARIGMSAESPHPVRVNVLVTPGGKGTVSWRPDNPLAGRLRLGTDNPADLGWLVFAR